MPVSEYVRSVRLRAEIDTNKQTYVLDLGDVDEVTPEQALDLVQRFFESCP